MHEMGDDTREIDATEVQEWVDSLDAVIDQHGLTATGRLSTLINNP